MKKTLVRIVALIVTVLLTVPAVATYAASEPATAAFDDVVPGAWYVKAVNYVYENSLMIGTDSRTFAPQAALSRAMSVRILANVAGADLDAYADVTPDFADVEAGQWYTAAVAWAVDKSIAVGTGELFDTDKAVTREELVLMMYKTATACAIKNRFVLGPEDLSGFVDEAEISPWALEAFTWAVHNGYICGDDNSCLNPRSGARRSEAAQIFFNLHYAKVNDSLPPDTSYVDDYPVSASTETRIICWGDSLTEGCIIRDGGYTFDLTTAYPKYLGDLTGIETLNCGISGESAEQIAMRQGGLPFYVKPVTIPAEVTAVPVVLELEGGYEADFGSKGLNGENMRAGVNPVIIGGVKGTLTLGSKGYEFTRLEEGEEVTLTRLTQVVTAAMADRRSNDVLVICSGSNNMPSPDNIELIIENIDAMIEFAGVGDRYVVMDFTAYLMMYKQAQVNAIMKEHYGDHLIELNAYMASTQSLSDAGITPSSRDLSDISQGHMPESLLFTYDYLHYLPVTNNLVALLVHAKLQTLGLID